MRARRRGVVLAIVGALVLVIAVGTFMLQRVMHQRYLESHRYTAGEVAVHLAEAGVNVTLERVREDSLRPGSRFHELLVLGRADAVRGLSEDLSSPFLDELVEILGDASLSVRVELRDFRAYQEGGGLRGVVGDPREKFGQLVVVARAEVRGVARTLHAARQVKVVNVTAPVLSKFTLFLRSRAGQDPNLLGYDRVDPAAGFTLEGAPASPLVLFHRPEQFPAVVDGRFDSLAAVFEDLVPDAGGLVYLGGEEPWDLNLVHGPGAGPLEEQHLLRRTRYRVASTLAGVEGEVGMTFGFYDGALESAPLGGAPGQPARLVGPTGGPVAPGTSALHLYGDVGNVSPTPVLGPVFRRYLTLRLLDGQWYPHRTPEQFRSLGTQAPFGGSYPEYARIMARVEHESYNRGFDYVATNSEALVDPRLVVARETPFVPAVRLSAAVLGRLGPAVAGDEHFLYAAPGAPSPGSVRLSRLGGGEREDLFLGALADLDGELLQAALTAKATYAVDDAAGFRERFLDGARVTTPGVLWVRRGDLELEDLQASRGLMILVEGSLTLRGPVTGQVGESGVREPITLVSLGGDVRVETGAAIQAQLVALRGRVRSRGRLEVQGGLAAESLDLRTMVQGPGSRRVTYDPIFDTTSPEAYAHQLQVTLDRRLRLQLEGH